MRKVNRTLFTKPVELTGVDCINHLNKINADPNATSASENIYKGRIKNTDNTYTNTVTIALRDLYKSKCAYCEKSCHYPRVEHFRPKGRVIGDQRSPNGYFWLCYEWTNLLPSCHECNSIEAKGDKFPIKGIRKTTYPINGNPPQFDSAQNIFNSSYLSSEDPYYIHPEYCDNFWIHFDFDREGKIWGVSDYGRVTIADLKLDDEDRNGWRRTIYEGHYNKLLKLIRRFKREYNPIPEVIFIEEIDELVEDIFIESEDESLPYTLFRKSLINKIKYFFTEPLDPVFQIEIGQYIGEALLKCIHQLP